MTLPGARLPRLDPVAVGTPDDALMPGDLRLDGGDGFEGRDVRGLALHVNYDAIPKCKFCQRKANTP